MAHLIDKIVSDALIQANKRGAVNDSLVEIDINETLVIDESKKTVQQEQQQTVLLIEPVPDQITIDQENRSVKFNGQQSESSLLHSGMATPPNQKTLKDECINQSTASISSVNVTKLANQKKNPIVDCFSCTIL